MFGLCFCSGENQVVDSFNLSNANSLLTVDNEYLNEVPEGVNKVKESAQKYFIHSASVNAFQKVHPDRYNVKFNENVDFYFISNIKAESLNLSIPLGTRTGPIRKMIGKSLEEFEFNGLSISEFVDVIYDQLLENYSAWDPKIRSNKAVKPRLLFFVRILEDLLNTEEISDMETLRRRWGEVREFHSIKHQLNLMIDDLFSDEKLGQYFDGALDIQRLPEYFREQVNEGIRKSLEGKIFLCELFPEVDLCIDNPDPSDVRTALKKALETLGSNEFTKIINEELDTEFAGSEFIEALFEPSDFQLHMEDWLSHFNEKHIYKNIKI